ncbi:MAG: PspC domain-containing protein [Bacteroidota bacterium]
MEDQNIHNELFGGNVPTNEPAAIKRLQRSADNRIITGVCGGIAEYFGMEAFTVRISAAILLLLGHWIVAVYLLIAYLLPTGKYNEALTEKEIHAAAKENFRTILSSLLIVTGLHFTIQELGIINSTSMFLLPNSFMFPLLAIAAGVFLLMNKFTHSKFSANETKNFYRTTNDKFVFGVCGGTAKYLGLDSSSLRIIFLLLTGLTLGLFATAYLIIAIKTQPEPPKHIFADE